MSDISRRQRDLDRRAQEDVCARPSSPTRSSRSSPVRPSRTTAYSSFSTLSSTISRRLSIFRRSKASILTPATKSIRHASDEEPFCALAFKLQNDPFVGPLTFFRVYSGTIEAGTYSYNSTTGKKERLGRIVRLQADKREEVKKVFAGEIAAAVGLKDALTSHTFCDRSIRSFSNHQIHRTGRLAAHRAEDKGRPGKDGHALCASSPTKIRPSASPPTRRPARPSSPAWANSTSRSWLIA